MSCQVDKMRTGACEALDMAPPNVLPKQTWGFHDPNKAEPATKFKHSNEQWWSTKWVSMGFLSFPWFPVVCRKWTMNLANPVAIVVSQLHFSPCKLRSEMVWDSKKAAATAIDLWQCASLEPWAKHPRFRGRLPWEGVKPHDLEAAQTEDGENEGMLNHSRFIKMHQASSTKRKSGLRDFTEGWEVWIPRSSRSRPTRNDPLGISLKTYPNQHPRWGDSLR